MCKCIDHFTPSLMLMFLDFSFRSPVLISRGSGRLLHRGQELLVDNLQRVGLGIILGNRGLQHRALALALVALVLELVAPELVDADERLGAHRALEFVVGSVYLAVLRQVRGLAKGLAAELASQRLLTRMGTLMHSYDCC